MSEATTTAVAIREETGAVMLTNAQLTMIANTSFVPAAFRGKVPEVLACVATGRALGLPDMTSLRGIHVIEGKATLSAELMVAIVRGHGHSITGTVDDKKAVVRGKRVDNGDTMDATFTLEMAAAAGLVNKNNWKKHPDDMMWARAVSRLCRRLFADCFAGASYVPEEVEPTADEVMDEPLEPIPDEADDLFPADKPADVPASSPGTAGGVTEPSVEPRTRDSLDAGSVTPWAALTQLAKKNGVDKDSVLEAARQRFPELSWDELSEDDCAVLWDSLMTAREQGAEVGA